jgi:hypothetical protein
VTFVTLMMEAISSPETSISLRGVLELLITDNVVPSRLFLFTLMLKAIRFSEKSLSLHGVLSY